MINFSLAIVCTYTIYIILVTNRTSSVQTHVLVGCRLSTTNIDSDCSYTQVVFHVALQHELVWLCVFHVTLQHEQMWLCVFHVTLQHEQVWLYVFHVTLQHEQVWLCVFHVTLQHEQVWLCVFHGVFYYRPRITRYNFMIKLLCYLQQIDCYKIKLTT
jgi:hypothetical protein